MCEPHCRQLQLHECLPSACHQNCNQNRLKMHYLRMGEFVPVSEFRWCGWGGEVSGRLTSGRCEESRKCVLYSETESNYAICFLLMFANSISSQYVCDLTIGESRLGGISCAVHGLEMNCIPIVILLNCVAATFGDTIYAFLVVHCFVMMPAFGITACFYIALTQHRSGILSAVRN